MTSHGWFRINHPLFPLSWELCFITTVFSNFSMNCWWGIQGPSAWHSNQGYYWWRHNRPKGRTRKAGLAWVVTLRRWSAVLGMAMMYLEELGPGEVGLFWAAHGNCFPVFIYFLHILMVHPCQVTLWHRDIKSNAPWTNSLGHFMRKHHLSSRNASFAVFLSFLLSSKQELLSV